MSLSKMQILLSVTLASLLGCSGATTLPELRGGSGGNPHNRNSAGQQFGSGNLFGDGNNNFFDSGDEGEDFVYPVFKFTGTGTLGHREGSNPVKQTMVGKVEKDTFSFETTEYYAIGGSHKDDVNKQLRDKVYGRAGIAAGNRAPAADLRAKESDADFVWAKFLIYAKDIRNTRSGESYTFSDNFVPVTAVPGSKARYDKVFAQNRVLTYRTQVTGSSSFQLVTTVTLTASDADMVEIQLSNEIIGDDKCQISGTFPLPRYVTYTIDTNRKLVTSMANSGSYHDDGRCHGTSAFMNLCETTKGDEAPEQHNGGCF